jgi:hypothetical protein
MGRGKPPTSVNCAPRMMALGSKAVSMAHHIVVDDASARREGRDVGLDVWRLMTRWKPRLARPGLSRSPLDAARWGHDRSGA